VRGREGMCVWISCVGMTYVGLYRSWSIDIVCEMTCAYTQVEINVWSNTFICSSRRFIFDTDSCVLWHDSLIAFSGGMEIVVFMCATWLIHMCDMVRTCVSYDLFMCVTWPIHVRDMTHSCVWHHSLICVTWLIYVCDIPHTYVEIYDIHMWRGVSYCMMYPCGYVRHVKYIK